MILDCYKIGHDHCSYSTSSVSSNPVQPEIFPTNLFEMNGAYLHDVIGNIANISGLVPANNWKLNARVFGPPGGKLDKSERKVWIRWRVLGPLSPPF